MARNLTGQVKWVVVVVVVVVVGQVVVEEWRSEDSSSGLWQSVPDVRKIERIRYEDFGTS